MATTSEQHLKQLEATYWDAIQRKDFAAAMQLSATDCVVVGAQGVGALDRAKLGEMLKQARYEITHYELDDASFQVRKISDGVAIVAYGVHEDLVVDGKAESLEAFDASVWVERDGEWVCALHTESLKGDPFGRHDEGVLRERAQATRIRDVKAVVEDLLDAHRKDDLGRVREVLSDDFVWHIGSSEDTLTRDDWLKGMEEGNHAFSDLKIETDQLIAEDDLVSARLVITGRHTGMFQGVSPTGKAIRFVSMWNVRVLDGRVSKVWMLDEDFLSKLRVTDEP